MHTVVQIRAINYLTRPALNDGDRFNRVMRQIVGKRLTWDKLTGKPLAQKRALTEKERRREGRGKRK